MKHSVPLQPFSVPNYVIAVSKPHPRQDGYHETQKFHLSELDANTLEQLCTEFRAGMFKKAGIQI